MATTTFSNGTVIPVAWLNEVNALLWGSASPPATPIRVNNNGAVGIGITPNSAWLSTRKPLQVGTFPAFWEQSSGASNIGFGLYESGVNSFSYMTTGDAPTLYSQISGRHIWYRASAGTAGNSVSLTQLMELNDAGLYLTSANTKLGYGTGTGGTVTQATSKSTAVTLNNSTGQITMNNAALGAGASVGFLVNNTSVSSTDLVLINTAGVTWGNYRIEAYNVTGGSFSVRLTNLSAGSLSDAVVFNFAVIKGSST